MSVAVSSQFQRLLAAIQPTPRELDKSNARLSRLSARLRDDFDVRRLFVAGSHWKGTAVRTHSDVDVFVVLSRDEARKWNPAEASSSILTRVRNSIRRTYPVTSLRKDGQAIVVRFEQGAHAIDVVPAIFESFWQPSRAPVYLIPDGANSWLRTVPDLQKSNLDEQQVRSGNKLKGLVQLLKWWAASRSSTSGLTSLYAEHFIVACQIPVSMTYPEALAEVLWRLARSKCPRLNDPLGVSSGGFPAARTAPQVTGIVAGADACADRAQRALEYDATGKSAMALQVWELVFNHVFPSTHA